MLRRSAINTNVATIFADYNQEIEENLIGVLGQVLRCSPENDTDETLGQHVRQTLSSQGGIADSVLPAPADFPLNRSFNSRE